MLYVSITMTLVVPSKANAYDRLRSVIPAPEWALFQPDIEAINALKRKRNAIILAHNYQTPEIFNCVADVVGDSLQLAREACRIEADVIVMAGVHFMAETVKLLNPDRRVLIPDTRAGCSLAESITPEDVLKLKAAHPGVPVVTYVNTSAAVKAVSDVCCTSGNARRIIEALGVPKVIMIPDEYLAQNIARETKVDIITWNGHCEVHMLFNPADIAELREAYPGVTVIAHPECPPDVVLASDFSGSTADMSNFVKDHQPKKIALITECSMSDNIAVQNPDVEFVRPCNLCPHMKRITLANIRQALEQDQHEVLIDPGLITAARNSVERMLAL